jgi:tetratricopeptide (TPR) repeat protein
MRSPPKRVRAQADKTDTLASSATSVAINAQDSEMAAPLDRDALAGKPDAGKTRPSRAAHLLQDVFAADGDGKDLESVVPLLTALLNDDAQDPEPALGLAICAARMGRTEEAYGFALECLRRGSKHPRAYCIIGLYQLETGDRGAAQANLAAATRLARARPELRGDLRLAQRLLLILNFGAPRRPARSRRRSKEAEANDCA